KLLRGRPPRFECQISATRRRRLPTGRRGAADANGPRSGRIALARHARGSGWPGFLEMSEEKDPKSMVRRAPPQVSGSTRLGLSCGAEVDPFVRQSEPLIEV